MTTLILHLDPANKKTLDKLAHRGQRSSAVRGLVEKYHATPLGEKEASRVRINISLTDKDRKTLDNLAKKNGISASEAINRMLKAERDAMEHELTLGTRFEDL